MRDVSRAVKIALAASIAVALVCVVWNVIEVRFQPDMGADIGLGILLIFALFSSGIALILAVVQYTTRKPQRQRG